MGGKKKQSNLDSFFGVPKQKRVKRQTKLDSSSFAVKKQKATTNKEVEDQEEPPSARAEEKENSETPCHKEETKRKGVDTTGKKKKKRLVIEESSDEEENYDNDNGEDEANEIDKDDRNNEKDDDGTSSDMVTEKKPKAKMAMSSLSQFSAKRVTPEAKPGKTKTATKTIARKSEVATTGAAKSIKGDDDDCEMTDTDEISKSPEKKVKSSPASKPRSKASIASPKTKVVDEKPTDVENKKESDEEDDSGNPSAVDKAFIVSSSSVGKKSNEKLLKNRSWKPLTEQNKSDKKKGSKATAVKGAITNCSVPFLALCEVFESIDGITGRHEIQDILTDLYREVLLTAPHDMEALLYLSSNSVAASYECVELGIGDSILIKAIGEAYGTNPSMIKQKYSSDGDLGTVAKQLKAKQRTLGFGVQPKPLSVQHVLSTFLEIAHTSGNEAQKRKGDRIKKLLVRAKGPEAKFIIRGLQGKLRIGLARSTVLIALAHAVAMTPISSSSSTTKSNAEKEMDLPPEAKVFANTKAPGAERLEAAVQIMKRAYSEVPSYKSLLEAASHGPLHELSLHCSLTPGIPVEPMLAKPTKSVQEVLKRLSGKAFTCEFKYDGERAQVHMFDKETRVFSRNLLNTSDKYPEVPGYVKEAAEAAAAKRKEEHSHEVMEDVTSFVMDTEVVAFNRETNKLVPFQILSTRKKSEASAETAKVQVIVQAFDLMYLNGVSLLSQPLSERRALLRKHFAPITGKFQFATALDHKEDGDTTVLEEFLETAVKSQCEGLMVKTLEENAAYEPSKRSLNWLKLKKDYLEGLGDSVDLVPLGAYNGKGKRTGHYGAYLLACYDPETEEFQSVCKIGTGFSDEDLTALHESFDEHIIDDKPAQYNTTDALECDVWFEACQVWEVKAADLSQSSAHRGAVGKLGSGNDDRGIGLRFPRFERVRTDKKPEQATSSEQILEMYYAQDSVKHEGGMEDDDEDGI